MAEFDKKSVAAWRKEVKGAKDDMKEIRDLTAVLEQSTKNLTASEIKRNKNMGEFLSQSEKAAKAGKLDLADLKRRKGLIEDLAGGQMDITQIKEKQKDLEAEQIKNTKNYKGANAEIGKQKNRELDADLALLASEEKRLKLVEMSGAAMSELDGITGGMSSKVQGFVETFKEMGPQVALVTAGLAMFGAMLTKFSGQIDAIGESFGAIGVQSFAKDLNAADAEMAKLGFDTGTAGQMAAQLSDNFGISFSEATKLTPQIADMSKALGMSTEEGTAFVGQLTTMTGMSAETAIDMAKMTEQLAKANGVAPGSVMRDIAASSKSVALFSQDSGENIMKGAIMAKKLGMNLDDVAGTMESMLDFTGAQQKAMEASVLLGRNINVTKMQELSLAGDAAGVLEEQRRLLGDANEFNKMNAVEKRALAAAVGLEVDQAAKLVSKTEEQASLAGELQKQPGFGDLVGKEAMSSLAELMGSLTAIGAELTNTFGPALDFITGIFSNLATQLKENKVLMTVLKVVVGALGAKLIWMGIGAIWSGANAALGWIPVVGPFLAAAAAVAGTAALLGAVGSAATAGDMSMQAGKAPMVSTNVGAFQLDKKDDLVAGPGVVDALNEDGTPVTTGGTSINVTPVVNAVVSLQGTVQLQQQELAALRTDMQSYLGPNGTLAKAVGKKTVAAINDQA